MYVYVGYAKVYALVSLLFAELTTYSSTTHYVVYKV